WTPIELATHEALEVARDEAEGVRVAYVAATRARDLLVVPAVGDVEWDGGWTGPLNGALYPPTSARRTSIAAAGCPAFRTDSVWKRPDDDPSTPLTVRPGLHLMPALDGSHPVVWWDPWALGPLGLEPELGLRRQSLIMKDVPEAVVAEGMLGYDTWRLRREAAIATGSVPSVSVRTATQWAATFDEHGAAPVATASDPRSTVQRSLFDEPAAVPAPSAGPKAEDEVMVVDARG